MHLNMLKNIISEPATPLLMHILKWSENSRTDRDIQIAVNNILKSIESLLIRRLVEGDIFYPKPKIIIRTTVVLV